MQTDEVGVVASDANRILYGNRVGSSVGLPYCAALLPLPRHLTDYNGRAESVGLFKRRRSSYLVSKQQL